MRITRTRYWATGAAATAALCLAGGAAFAAVSGTPIASTNGTAGYGALAPGVQTFTNVQSTITTNQYATTVKGGVIGVQLSTAPVAGVCQAAQAGEVANTTSSTFSVQYGLGTIGTAANPCPVGGALAPVDRHTFTGLGAVANTDDVWVSVSTTNNCKIRHGSKGHYSYGVQKCKGHQYKNGTLTFYAQDLTTNSPVIVATLPNPATNKFVNAAAGGQQDLAPLTNCAVVPRLVTDNAMSPVAYSDATCQFIARFSYTTASLNGGPPQSLDLLNATEAFADATTAANSAANPAQVSAQNSLSTTVHGPAGPASFGASGAGSDFTLNTANSIG